MRKLFTCLAGLCLFAGGVAHAITIGTELTTDKGTIQPGTTYTLAKGDYYTYKVEEAANITIQTNYTQASINDKIGWKDNFSLSTYFSFYLEGDNQASQLNPAAGEKNDTGWVFTYALTSGQTLIIGYPNALTDMTVGFNFYIPAEKADPVPSKMTACTPEPGTVFDPGLGINDVNMDFDQKISSIEKVVLAYTNQQGSSQEVEVPSGTTGWEIVYGREDKVVVRIANTNNVYNTAKADADGSKPYYIKMYNVQAALGPVDGTTSFAGSKYVTCADNNISIEYNFADPVTMQSYKLPETFYSYWAPGETAGMGSFTFDGPVDMSKAVVTLTMGKQVRGSQSSGDDPDPFWNVPYTLSEDKKTLTLNFTGIEYKWSNTKSYDQVTFGMSGVYGENGLVADFSGVGYFDQYIPFVNETYGNVEIPENIETVPTIDPANGTKLSELVDVAIEWEGETITAIEGMIAQADVVFGTNAPVKAPIVVEDGIMIVELSAVTVPENGFTGEMTVTIPSNLVKNEKGSVNAEINLTYNVTLAPPVNDEVTLIGQAVAVENLTDKGVTGVSITWGQYAIAINDDNTEAISVQSTTAVTNPPVVSNVKVNGKALQVDFSNPITEGFTLSISIPQGYVFVGEDGALNAAQTLTLKLTATGVSVIGNENGKKVIYNLQGVRMNENNLQPGIYVIDGKKVVIRK